MSRFILTPLTPVIMLLSVSSAITVVAAPGSAPLAARVEALVRRAGSLEAVHVRPQDRIQAVNELVTLGAAAVPFLVPHLESPQVHEVLEVTNALTRISRPATPALVALLERGQPPGRRAATGILASIADPAAAPALIRALRVDPDPRTRAGAAVALGSCGDAAVLPDLAGLLADPRQPPPILRGLLRAVRTLLLKAVAATGLQSWKVGLLPTPGPHFASELSRSGGPPPRQPRRKVGGTPSPVAGLSPAPPVASSSSDVGVPPTPRPGTRPSPAPPVASLPGPARPGLSADLRSTLHRLLRHDSHGVRELAGDTLLAGGGDVLPDLERWLAEDPPGTRQSWEVGVPPAPLPGSRRSPAPPVAASSSAPPVAALPGVARPLLVTLIGAALAPLRDRASHAATPRFLAHLTGPDPLLRAAAVRALALWGSDGRARALALHRTETSPLVRRALRDVLDLPPPREGPRP